jgi:hypothetical protein
LLITVPPPVPPVESTIRSHVGTVVVVVSILKVAVAVRFPVIVKMQVPVPVQGPLHPANVIPESGTAVRVTLAPSL